MGKIFYHLVNYSVVLVPNFAVEAKSIIGGPFHHNGTFSVDETTIDLMARLEISH